MIDRKKQQWKEMWKLYTQEEKKAQILGPGFGHLTAEKEVLGVKMRKETKPNLVTGSSLHFAAERKTQVNSKGCAVY